MTSSDPRTTDTDALLRAIGQAARQSSTHATRSDHEDAAESSDSTADDALVARITGGVLAQQARERAVTQARPTARRHRGWWAGVAAAASVVLALAWLAPGSRPSALPRYSAEVSGFDSTHRAAIVDTRLQGAVTLGNRLVVTLRPDIAASGPIVARLWRADGSDLHAVDVPLQVSANGTVRLDVRIGDELPLSVGTHRFWLVAARDSSALDARGLPAIADQPDASGDRYVVPLTLDVRAP